MDVFAGTIGFVVTISVIGLLDVLIDKYQYRSELTGFQNQIFGRDRVQSLSADTLPAVDY